MANGSTHDKVNLISIFIVMGLIFAIGGISLKLAVVLFLGYLFGTFYLSPDLDLKSTVFKRWGVFSFIWSPYQKMFIHRSLFTHMPILSDAIRVVFISIFMSMSYFGVYLIKVFKIYSSWFDIAAWVIGIGIVIVFLIRTIKLNNKNSLFHIVLFFIYVTTLFFFGKSIDEGENIAIKGFFDFSYEMLIFFCGVVLSTAVHTVTDILYSFGKKAKKTKRVRK